MIIIKSCVLQIIFLGKLVHHPVEAIPHLFPHRDDVAGGQSVAVEAVAVSPRQRPEVGVVGAQAAVPVSDAAAASKSGQKVTVV